MWGFSKSAYHSFRRNRPRRKVCLSTTFSSNTYPGIRILATLMTLLVWTSYFLPLNWINWDSLRAFLIVSRKKKKILYNLPTVGSSILLQWSWLQQYVVVTCPVFEDGAHTNGLSRGIRSISAIHMLLFITLSVVSVTETKQSPSVTQVKLSFVQRWQKHCNAGKKEKRAHQRKLSRLTILNYPIVSVLILTHSWF